MHKQILYLPFKTLLLTNIAPNAWKIKLLLAGPLLGARVFGDPILDHLALPIMPMLSAILPTGPSKSDKK